MQRTCCSGSPEAQFCFWLRSVPTATVVLPVWRSPMMSWRWPRPIGVMASTDFRPVWSGSGTGGRRVDGGARDGGRRLARERASRLGVDLAQTVDRLGERVDDAAEECVPDGH